MAATCRTRLISDAPASTDAFGSHQRVATVLADLLRADRGGKAIGLEGGWGSGKSTVVNILRAKTDPDPDLALLVFDAWAHEGDPLRRTFLETLISKFVDVKWISQQQWAERMDYFSKRKKISETATTPRLTPFAKYLLTSTFVVPIGFALLNSALRDPIYLLPGTGVTIAWQFLIGLLLSLAPLFVLLWARIRDASAETWAVLVRGTTTTTLTEAIETPEPTSVEFQSVFVDLMEAALGSDTNRRAVLVVDNLDRVAPDDALSIWSSLGTFFQLSEHRCPSWFTRFWVVVPYDPLEIQRLWSGADDAKKVTSSFLSKTFQLRLSVPPLLVSNWRTYLDELLREALPDHNQRDFHAVYRLYASLLEPSRSPTPRSLKLYVNDIGGLHRQWQDELPLSDLAYYVLLRHRGIDVVEALRSRMVPAAEVQDLVSPDIEENLAAIAFNASVPDARQLLLRDKLTQALEQADTATLISLASSPGIWEVLEAIDFSQWSEHEPFKLATAARCIEESGIVSILDSAMKHHTLSHLRSAALAVREWQPLGTETSRGLTALCRLCGNQQLAQHVLATLLPDDARGEEKTQPADWSLTVVALLRTLKELHLDPAAAERIPIPGPAKNTLLACHHLAKQDSDARFWKDFRVNVSSDALDGALTAALKDDSLLPTLVDALPVLRAIGAQVKWETIVTTLRSRLEALDALAATSLEALLDILVDLRSNMDSAQSALSSLASGGHLLHHLHTVYPRLRGANTAAAARCLILHLKALPSLPAPPGTGNAAAGHSVATQLISAPPAELVSAITKYLSATDQSDLLFEISGANAAIKPLAVECLRRAANPNDVADFFPPETIVSQWPLLSEVPTDETRESFATLLMQNTALVQHLKEREFVPDLGSLYALLVRSGAANELQQVCVAGLNAIDLDRWKAEFKLERNLAELVVDLVEARINFELSHQYRDGLLEHAREMVAGIAKPTYLNAAHWEDLLAPLHPDIRRVFRGDLFEVAVTAQGRLPKVFFEFYGKELARPEVLNEARAFSGLFTSLLKTGNVYGLRWMIDFLKTEPGFLFSHPNKSAVEDFRRRLTDMLESEAEGDPEGARALRLELANTIGVERRNDAPPK